MEAEIRSVWRRKGVISRASAGFCQISNVSVADGVARFYSLSGGTVVCVPKLPVLFPAQLPKTGKSSSWGSNIMAFLQPAEIKLLCLFIVLEVQQSSTLFSERRSDGYWVFAKCVE